MISTSNANLFTANFVKPSRSLLTTLRSHGDRKYNFLFSVKSGQTAWLHQAFSFSAVVCSSSTALCMSPNGISLCLMSFISGPYILFHNNVFLTDLPVAISGMEKITWRKLHSSAINKFVRIRLSTQHAWRTTAYNLWFIVDQLHWFLIEQQIEFKCKICI